MPPEKPLIWTHTHLSPTIAKWLDEQFNVAAVSFYKLNFHTAGDYSIFMKAKEKKGISITKDKDYIKLLTDFKAPPHIILLKAGNLSYADLKKLRKKPFQRCLDQILNHNYKITEID